MRVIYTSSILNNFESLRYWEELVGKIEVSTTYFAVRNYAKLAAARQQFSLPQFSNNDIVEINNALIYEVELNFDNSGRAHLVQFGFAFDSLTSLNVQCVKSENVKLKY